MLLIWHSKFSLESISTPRSFTDSSHKISAFSILETGSLLKVYIPTAIA
jgi:hypothetical protein